MKIKSLVVQTLTVFLALSMTVPPSVFAQDAPGKPAFKQEELEQLLAPIALYPDSLLTQILMASTYPLELVQADRWAKKNKDMKGDALAKALEAQPWDPSVKSLVNFPQVLQMMSEKLDLTQKLGDAFLAQQKDVMATIQKLRAKAKASGNLKTTKEQVVKVEQEVIIIESASPQVVYVPSYNPTVVYGTWAYPAYPPAPYYPPGYGAGAAFVTGVAVGAAWGYAWGNANWHGGDVNVNVNQNANLNQNINRSQYQQKYQNQTGQYNQMSKNQQAQAQQKAQQRQAGQQAAGSRGGGSTAFSGMDKGGSGAREASSRGSASAQSMSSGGGSRGGGGGGGSRGGGGGGGRR